MSWISLCYPLISPLEFILCLGYCLLSFILVFLFPLSLLLLLLSLKLWKNPPERSDELMPKRVKRGTVRATAQPFLEAFAAQGLSANEALRRLREMGLGYRRQDFLNDYRTYTGKEKAKDVAKYIRKDRYPTEAVMTPDVRNLKNKYQSLIVYEYQDLRTGEIKTKNFYIGHDRHLMVGTIEQIAGELITDNLDTYNARLISYGYRGTRYRVD